VKEVPHLDASRVVLPIPDRPHTEVVHFDASNPDSRYPAIEPLRPPEGAPNILIILIDDAGFGSSSAFGGPCQTPNAERLAAGGLRFTRFHTTALCSPTRQALLTGRNHHSVGMGNITELATGLPGFTSIRPKAAAPIAMTLKLNGYSTAQFGKCHEVPVWETSPIGPFDAWPTGGGGFEYFYGFLGGETNQWYPSLFDGTVPVELDKTPEEGYHLVDDMTSKAIKWIGQQKALAPDKPFFVYFAPGACHAPHHAPREWIDKYKGKFDQGWDKVREETFERQKKLGVIPADAQLTPRHEEIPAWDDMPAELKPVLSRQMEVYAAFLEYTDHNVGRILGALEKLGILDDTLIYYIIGDNGASAEGTLQGSFNEMINLNGLSQLETPEFLLSHLEDFGGPKSYGHYAVGWAHAMDTPYQWTKQVASHWGGTRNGTIVHWPKGIKAKGEMRNQFAHVIDVAPTLLEVAGLPAPSFVNGTQQMALEGTSMAYCFDDPGAEERHVTQYFELWGNRGIYHKGWTAVARHRTPWLLVGIKPRPFDDDEWELYDTTKDWTQANNLAAQMPEKLHELQRLWLIQAARYNALPLDDRGEERADPDRAGRPRLIKGNAQVLFRGMGRLGENCVVNIKCKSHNVSADLVVPEGGAQGVIVAQGGICGGWSFYVKDGKLKYCYNLLGIHRFYTEGTTVLTPGEHTVRMEFAYEGGGPGKGGKIALYLDGRKDGEGGVAATEPVLFSADDTCDVGVDAGSPISEDYGSQGNAFNGDVKGVLIEAGDDSYTHMIDAEQVVHMLLARQ
jgi:arylsulfatase A-like enzyme